MDDLIDRQAAIDALETVKSCLVEEEHQFLDCLISDMKKLPSAEPERKKGKWIETDEYHGFNDEVNHKAIACSVCKVAFNGWYGYGVEEMIEDFRYCPNCGAYMREEE